ncbi:MAG: polysaccharide biosynthesis C-terminal domain-containing protein [Caldilineaceae bacterium]
MKKTTQGGLFLIGSTIVIAMVNYALSIFLSWMLTPAQYGMIGVSQSLIFVGSWFLIAGFPWVSAQKVATLTVDELSSAYPLLNSALWANGLLGFLVALGLCSAVWLGIVPLAPDYRIFSLLIALIVILLAIRLAITPVLQGRLLFAQLSWVTLIEATVQFMVALGLVMEGWGVSGALAGFATGSAVSLLVALWLTRSTAFWRWPSFDLELIAKLRPAIPLLVANMSGVLLVNLDMLLLRLLIVGQDEWIGYYQVVAVLARIPYYISQSANTMIFPMVARNAAHADEADQTSRQALRYVLSFIFSLCLVLTCAPRATIAFFFPTFYLPAAPILALLSLGIGMIILAQTVATLCQARRQSRPVALVLPFAVAVQIVACLWLIPRYQLQGAAWSSCLAGGVALIGMLVVLRRQFGQVLRLSRFDVFRQFAAFLLLGISCAALPLLGRLSTALWIATALTLYLASLLWLKLIDPAVLSALSLPALPSWKSKSLRSMAGRSVSNK